MPKSKAASATAIGVLIFVVAVAATSGSGAPAGRDGHRTQAAEGKRPRAAVSAARLGSRRALAARGADSRRARPGAAPLAAGGAAPTAAGAAAGQSPAYVRADPMGPFFTAQGRNVLRFAPADPGRRVALVFDDGPGPQTLDVVHELKRVGARATFFLIGREIPQRPQVVRAVRDAGMELGDHSWSHSAMSWLDARTQRLEVAVTAAEIARVAGVRPLLFRPPDIAWNADTARAVAAEGELGVLHTVETLDWERPGAQAIARAAETADAGDIVALHDAGGDRSETVAAIAPIVRTLHRRGLECVTVSELLGRPAPGQTPYGFADLERALARPGG